MNNDTLSMPSLHQLPQAAKDITRLATDAASEAAHRTATVAKEAAGAAKEMYQAMSAKIEDGVVLTKDYAQQAADATKDAAHRATDAAKDLYQSASVKAEDALASSKEYVRQNPFPVALGTLIAGVVIGCLIGMTHREEPTFRQRFFR